MKSCFRFLFIVAIFLLLSPAIRSMAQSGVNSSGTDYWLQFMPNGAGAGNTSVYEELFIASGTANKVTVSGPISKTFVLTAGQVYDIPLTDVMNSTDETVQDDAIHITSVNPITVYGFSAWGNPQGIGDSPDGFLALPIQAYGTEYYTVNFPDNYVFGNMPGEFLITSPYDANNIKITPASQTKAGRPAGQTFSITLNKGETYLVQSPGNNFGANDLTGSLIVSSKPISVLTGHQISSVPTDCGCFSADNLFEMIPSVDRWGTQYFDEPMAGKTVDGDYLRILSAENGNQIATRGTQSGLHQLAILDSGQYTDITQNTEPLVITSTNNKRFIVAQYSYSQGVNGDPGYSDPWMVLFTPQQQFEKEMIFRTPTASKGAFTNYLTIIALNDSIRKITINGLPLSAFPSVGQDVFAGTNPQMGVRRVILDSKPNDYIAKSPVPFAMYQYGFSDYSGYGWPTGFAQHLISPDTLPPLASTLDSNCGNYTVRYKEPRLMKNGFSFNDTRIASISLITATGDPRWATPSYNYTFTPDPNFITGDSVYNATLIVNDPTKDAYAAVYAVDLAGNDTVYQYYYYAPKVTFTPQPTYNFGELLVGTDSCQTITITNVQRGGAFNAQTASVGGFATGGTFNVTPGTLTPIDSGKTLSLSLCFHPTDTGVTSIDSLYVTSECVNFAMPVMGTAVTPLIYANDLAFGEVDSGQTLCKPLTIRNPGKWPLTITKQNLTDNADFSVDPNQTFPIVIPPGQQVTINYCFHPQSWGNFSSTALFSTQNPSPFEHSIKDTASLTGIAEPAGVKLTSYVKSFTVGCNDTTLYDTVYDNLPASESITARPTWIGADSSFFTLQDNTPYPFELKADSVPPFIYLAIVYHPTNNGLDLTPRTVHLRINASLAGTSEQTQPELTIQAQLVTPIVQLSTNSIDLGTARVNQSTGSKTFTIHNAGNKPLLVNSYNLAGADASAFTFAPAPPFTIAPGDSQVVSVSAVGSELRAYNGTGSIDGSCNNQTFSFKANFTALSAVPQGTTHPVTYAGGCRSNTQFATLQNVSGTDSITLVSLTITGANGWVDTSDFALENLQSTVLPPNSIDSFAVTFTPQATGTREAALVFVISAKNPNGQDTTWTEVRELIGTGAIVSRQVGIGTVTASTPTPLDTHSVPAGAVSIPIVINTPIDVNAPNNGTNEAYGYGFDVSWKRDAFQYNNVISPAGVVVGKATYNAATDMETRHISFRSPTPLSGKNTLATLTVQSMLSKEDSTGIAISNVQWLDKDSIPLCYVTDSSFNGAQVLDPVCGSATLQKFMSAGSISLDGIQPNPVGNSAQINYTLAGPRAISAAIYDQLGNVVKTLASEEPLTEGPHSLQFTTDGLASGTYYCRLTDGHFVATQLFTIQK